ncbi:MAG TPA: hypothetical protein VNM69_10210 [Bacillus sp. (in: firmicutes)]|nr:hypothetical protein [Bacillus sp. (in: firmicutes)]
MEKNQKDQEQGRKGYEPPTLYPLGDLVSNTLGSKFNDTADLKNYYS